MLGAIAAVFQMQENRRVNGEYLLHFSGQLLDVQQRHPGIAYFCFLQDAGLFQQLPVRRLAAQFIPPSPTAAGGS